MIPVWGFITRCWGGIARAAAEAAGSGAEAIDLDVPSAQTLVREYLRLFFTKRVPKAGKDGDVAARLVTSLARNLGQATTYKTMIQDMYGTEADPASLITEETLASYLSLLKSSYFFESGRKAVMRIGGQRNAEYGAKHLRSKHATFAKAKYRLGRATIVCAALLTALVVGLGIKPTEAKADEASDNGIVVNLHDYERSGNNGWSSQSTDINDDHDILFGNTGSENTWNRYVGNNHGAWAGIVQNQLVGGYPELNFTVTGSTENLEYLFDSQNVSYIHNYSNVTGLLTKGTDGYYEFDSARQYARYNSNSNSFILSDYPRNDGQPSTPQFTPFDDRYDSNYNYSFGMDISATFYMPENGQVNDQDMVFSFSGDDDVWVFVDDVLVLDLGGIHDACSGTINFATGQITYGQTAWRNDSSRPSTLQEAFKDATGEDWDGTAYKTHTLKFFYLERGDGGSNCRIRFNLPTIPEGSVEIEKDVDYSNIPNAVSDIDFTFNAYIDYDGDGENYQLYTGPYDVYVGDRRVQTGLTATNGVITLKDGQTARLITGDLTEGQQIMRTSNYYVVETGASSDKYEVEVNGTTARWVQGDEEGSVVGATTPELTVMNTAHVLFSNSIVAQNAFNFEVHKAGNVNSNDQFYAKVMVGSKEYTGEYVLHHADGKTTSNESTNNGIIPLKAGEYAEIVGLAGGNTVTVSEVDSSGNAFINQQNYNDPSYDITGSNDTVLATHDEVMSGDAVTGISGTASEGTALGDSPVISATITNSVKVQDLTVSGLFSVNKIVHNHDLAANQFDFTVTPVEGTNTTASDAATLANIDAQGETFHNGGTADAEVSATVRSGNQITFTSAMVGNTYAFEYREVQNTFDNDYAGQDWTTDYTFDGNTYRVELTPELNDGQTALQVKMEIFKVVNGLKGDKVGNTVYYSAASQGTGAVTFENTYNPLALQITKTDEGGANKLEGAYFAVYGADGEGNMLSSPLTTIHSTATLSDDNAQGAGGFKTNSDGIVTFYNLQRGQTYYVKEVSMPSGYEANTNIYKIEINSDGSATLTKLKADGTQIGESEAMNTTQGANTIYTMSLENTHVTEIPQTGGSGSVGMGVAGVAIVTCTGAWLVSKRKGFTIRS